MGVSTSRPLRNRPKRSEKLHKSVEEVYECDFSRSSISIEGGEGRGKGGGGEGRGKGGGGPGFNFQDRIWSKPSRGRSQSVHDIYLQTAKSDQAPVYASIPSDDTTTPTYANVDKRIVDVTSGTVAIESNQVTGDDGSCLKGDKTRFQPTDVNDCTFGCPEPNLQKRSSLSSIYVKLPPVPECLDAEKEKLCGRECQKTGIVADKGMSYMTAQCIEKSDPLLDSHECTLVNELFIDPSMVAKYSETTGKAGSESDEVETRENESSSELSIPKVTMRSDDAVRHKEEEMTGHGSVITVPGCDAANRDLQIQETKQSVCEYELVPDNYGLRRDASYKSGKLFLNERRLKPTVANLHPSPRQPSKSQTATVSGLPTLQSLPFQPALQPTEIPPSQASRQQPALQSPQIPPPQASRPSSVEASRHQLHHNQVLYRVDPGRVLRVPGLTVNAPAQVNPGESYVELQWSSDLSDFPVQSVDQRFLTDVLHCHLHGSTFTSPVVVTLDLPVNQGQIEVLYSPTDVDQTPIWRKFRVIDGCMGGNTRFTDGQSPPANRVLLLKNGRKAVLVLRHFGSFVVVENGSVVQPRKAEVAIFLQTKICDHESWSAIVKVVVGCDQNDNDMHRKHKSLGHEGYRLVEKTGLLLYKADSDSGVEIGIRDVEWMVGCTQKQSKTSMIHGLDCLWSGMEATSLFWMTSEGSKEKEEQLTFTIYVRQDGRLEKPIGVYCNMTNDRRRLSSKPKRITATRSRSTPALLKTPFKLHHEGYTTTTPDSDLSLKTEDVSSRRRDDEISDSDEDFELNYCATDKAVTSEDVSDSKTPYYCKRLSHFVDDTKKVGVYEPDPVSSMSKGVNRSEYSAEDMNRITATVGTNFINQSDLEWILAG